MYILLAQVLAVSVPFAVVSFIKGVKLKTLLNDLMLHIEISEIRAWLAS